MSRSVYRNKTADTFPQLTIWITGLSGLCSGNIQNRYRTQFGHYPARNPTRPRFLSETQTTQGLRAGLLWRQQPPLSARGRRQRQATWQGLRAHLADLDLHRRFGGPRMVCTQTSENIEMLKAGRKGDEIPRSSFVLGSAVSKMANAVQNHICRWGRNWTLHNIL